MHLRETSVCKPFIPPQYRAPELFLGVIDGWQKIPEGAVIKQEVERVTEQTRSWLTPPSRAAH